MPTKKNNLIKFSELDKIENPTLADILTVLNGGKAEKFFLKKAKQDGDGYKQPFTAKGAKLYGALTSILFAVGRLTGDSTEDTVETLDEIANEE